MRVLKVYAETSVFGGVFDDTFTDASKAFFDQVKLGLFQLLVSDVLRQEIDLAPDRVRALFHRISLYAENIPVDDAVLNLRDAYVSSGIVGAKWRDDAAHVAAATVAEADLIVSWNFKHIVHFLTRFGCIMR